MNIFAATAGATTLVDYEGYAMKIHTDGTIIKIAAETDSPIGPLVSGAAVGESVAVAAPGAIAKVKLSGTVKRLQYLQVAADATYLAAAFEAAEIVAALALEDGVSGDLVNALVTTPAEF